MKNKDKFNFSDFTHENYEALIKIVKKYYIFSDFKNYSKFKNFMLWRHDIDMSVHNALKLADIEHKLSVSATYFIHLHSLFYNPFEYECRELLKKIIKLGHNIGLHFDTQFYENCNDQVKFETLLKNEKEILSNLVGCPIEVFSFHNPSEEIINRYSSLNYSGMINTYSSFFRNEVGYCSDSNGYWRHNRLEDVLNSNKYPCMQVLTHPIWWDKQIMSPKQKIRKCIEQRAKETENYYDNLLDQIGRLNIDW